MGKSFRDRRKFVDGDEHFNRGFDINSVRKGRKKRGGKKNRRHNDEQFGGNDWKETIMPFYDDHNFGTDE